MTIVVAIRCDSGVVVAADSMMTTFGSEGPLGHHKGKKISVLGGNKISAFAGDLGLGARFSLMAQHTSQDKIDEELDPLDYATQLSEDLVRKFARTGIPTDCQLAAILAFCHRESVCCCEFNSLQPQLLDENLFYTSMGSGTLSTDSFLRFLVDTYCKNQMPSIGKARFLANWAVQHAIDTAPGGVAGPICMATLERSSSGHFEAKELSQQEVGEYGGDIERTTREMLNLYDELEAGKQMPEEDLPPQARRKSPL